MLRARWLTLHGEHIKDLIEGRESLKHTHMLWPTKSLGILRDCVRFGERFNYLRTLWSACHQQSLQNSCEGLPEIEIQEKELLPWGHRREMYLLATTTKKWSLCVVCKNWMTKEQLRTLRFLRKGHSCGQKITSHLGLPCLRWLLTSSASSSQTLILRCGHSMELECSRSGLMFNSIPGLTLIICASPWSSGWPLAQSPEHRITSMLPCLSMH